MSILASTSALGYGLLNSLTGGGYGNYGGGGGYGGYGGGYVPNGYGAYGGKMIDLNGVLSL